MDAIIANVKELKSQTEVNFGDSPAMVRPNEGNSDDHVLLSSISVKNHVKFGGDAAFFRKCGEGPCHAKFLRAHAHFQAKIRSSIFCHVFAIMNADVNRELFSFIHLAALHRYWHRPTIHRACTIHKSDARALRIHP